jgi:hypothetical protein
MFRGWQPPQLLEVDASAASGVFTIGAMFTLP